MVGDVVAFCRGRYRCNHRELVLKTCGAFCPDYIQDFSTPVLGGFDSEFVNKILNHRYLNLQNFGHKNLRVYVGKTENRRGMSSLFSSNFSMLAEKITRKQRDCSEMIRGSTSINWVCEKRGVSSKIDAVYDKHSI